jgi:hypothetical protein
MADSSNPVRRTTIDLSNTFSKPGSGFSMVIQIWGSLRGLTVRSA